jgi:hypothetical protein
MMPVTAFSLLNGIEHACLPAGETEKLNYQLCANYILASYAYW